MSTPKGAEPAANPPSQEAPWPGPVKSWYMVSILSVAYALSFLDRQILTLLVDPIRRDLEITDFQMSLLMGIAFAAFYSVLGLPISRLIDRKSRRQIVFFGIAFWSLMTAACGMARNYSQLFLARIGIGAGEACLNPSAFSMVSDSFPEKKRGLAIAVFSLGIPVGAGLALIVGGTVIELVREVDLQSVPVFKVLYSWQLTFIIIGLPGLLIALLMQTVQEPKRRGLIRGAGGAEQRLSIPEVAAFINARRLAYFAIFFGVAMKVTLGYGSNSWIPTYFIRTFDWTAGEFGRVYGSVAIVSGVASNLISGFLANRLAARGRRDSAMMVILWGYFIAIPFAIAAPLVGSSTLAIVLFLMSNFFTGFHVLAPATLMAISPNQMRGQVSAIYVFVLNIIGLGFGPSIIAAFTDFVFGSDAAVGYSLSLTAATLGPLGAIILFLGLKQYRRCLDDALAWEEAETPAGA